MGTPTYNLAKLEEYKNLLKETEIEVENLLNYEIKQKKFDAKRFLNFDTVNYLDFKTFGCFKVVASENFADKTKIKEEDTENSFKENRAIKTATKHQVFLVGNKIIKNANHNEDLISEVAIGFKIVGLWEFYQSIKQQLKAFYKIEFSAFLAMNKLIDFEKKRVAYNDKNSFNKETDSYYYNYIKEHQTEDYIAWNEFITSLENDERIYKNELSDKLSEEKRYRSLKKDN